MRRGWPKVWGAGSGCSPLWGAWPGATFEAVNATGKPRRLGLEVRFDVQPIYGRLYDREDDGRLDRPFSGWLGLMSAIEAASGADPAPREQEGETR